MACRPHTDIERRALWRCARRLLESGLSRTEAISLLYRDWRPPFDFSRIRWAVEDGHACMVIGEVEGARAKRLAQVKREAMRGSEKAARQLKEMAARIEVEREMEGDER